MSRSPVGNRTWGSTVGGEHSRKEPFAQFVNSYSEHLSMSARPVQNACVPYLLSSLNNFFSLKILEVIVNLVPGTHWYYIGTDWKSLASAVFDHIFILANFRIVSVIPTTS
jgi:hypothetical protein